MKNKTIKNDTKSRSWFCVWNNPQNHIDETEPEKIIYKIIEIWTENHPTRTCAINYEIGDNGTPHCHMVLEDSNQVRFSTITNMFSGIHVEETKGNKAQAEDYIYKREPFSEKKHTLVHPPVFYGEIKAHQGARNDLYIIQELLEQGKTPNQILDENFLYRKHETMIRKHFFRLREKSTPPHRKITVYWHVGESGSGKSFFYTELCEKYGRDNIFLLTDYDGGGFDTYCAEKYLFMDEFKGNMKFQTLLNILDNYPTQLHCRYANALSLWDEVHITSVYPPEEIYKVIVDKHLQSIDSYKQLKRRIDNIIFHYKENDVYKSYQLPMKEYVDYDQLIKIAISSEKGAANK